VFGAGDHLARIRMNGPKVRLSPKQALTF